MYGFKIHLFLQSAFFHVKQYIRLSVGGEQFFAYLLEYFCEQRPKSPANEQNAAEEKDQTIETDFTSSREKQSDKQADL